MAPGTLKVRVGGQWIPISESGPPGATGPIGVTGPQGPIGVTGAQGVQGVPGLTGPPGAQGPIGVTGPQGPIGPEGPQGSGIVVKGTVGTASELPPTGNTDGDAWIAADTGHLWVWSDDAGWVDAGELQGPQGPAGPQGSQGVPGPQGLTGPQGSQGPEGPQGVEGPPVALTQSFLTVGGEPTLANSRALVAGENITLDATTPGQLIVTGAAGGGGGSTDLEYSGAYVPMTIYNDGDIVVAADGIAYMCVVSGTTTPPEPWPGVGVASAVGPPGPQGPQGDTGATGATGPKGDKGDTGSTGSMGSTGPQGPPGQSAAIVADATYWTSTPHGTLTNERAMNALAPGYVKSSGGNPSTVAVIPVGEGGTSATDAATARANLGVGTLGAQNSNNVYTSGGTIAEQTVINTQQWCTCYAFVGDGSNLSNLNASLIAYGTVPLARLGAGGAANTSTFLRGDNTWQVPPQFVFPSGLIVLSVSPCPPGWTRVVWDGLFLRVGPTPGAQGGATTHSHGVSVSLPSHTHDPGSLFANGHSHGGQTGRIDISISGSTGGAGGHDHHYSGNVNGTTSGESAGTMNVDGGNSGNMSRGPHTHGFAANFDGRVDGIGDHAHSFSGSGSGYGSIANEAVGIGGTSAAGGGGSASGGSDAQNHLPPFIDIYLCQKN